MNEDGVPSLSLCDEPPYLYRPKDTLAALAIFVEAVKQSKNKAMSFDLDFFHV
jgi:hypothetical protein